MSERNPGVRIWSARSIIAIRAIFILAVLLPVNVLAGGRIEYLVNTARTYSHTPLPATAFLVKTCAGNVLCAARHIARHIGPRARLEKTTHPDTDTIRRVKSRPSITHWKTVPPKHNYPLSQSLWQKGCLGNHLRI